MTHRLYFPKLTKSQFQNPNGHDVYECDRYAYSIRKTYRLVDPYDEGGLIGVWDLPFIQSRNIVTFGDLVAKIPKMVSDDCEVVICITGDDSRIFLESISCSWFYYLTSKYEKPKDYESLQYAKIESCRVITVETRTTYNIKFCEGEILKSLAEYFLDERKKHRNDLKMPPPIEYEMNSIYGAMGKYEKNPNTEKKLVKRPPSMLFMSRKVYYDSGWDDIGASNEPDFDGDTFTIVDAKNKKHKYSSLYGEQKK